MRFVLDTASFVTAVRSSDGAAGEVLKMIFRREAVPLMEPKLALEYRDVAMRPHQIAASHPADTKTICNDDEGERPRWLLTTREVSLSRRLR